MWIIDSFSVQIFNMKQLLHPEVPIQVNENNYFNVADNFNLSYNQIDRTAQISESLAKLIIEKN